jgi:hypothetical protein
VIALPLSRVLNVVVFPVVPSTGFNVKAISPSAALFRCVRRMRSSLRSIE